ncbi:MAG: bifunctional 2-polyprenyl-6-hydroxyphenol methylase/3-demethylubiquinol 3-O-methyltransferase UbiG [Alphaproteobacteria bacterium]
MTSDPQSRTGARSAAPPSVDPEEVERFSKLAAEWWNPAGKFRPLHVFNPVRLAFIRDEAARRFGRDTTVPRPFEGLTLLDIGCGGGLLSEPMTRLGFRVTAVDASEANIKTATIHAREQGLDIDYRHGSAEALAGENARFDVILNMEVVEHVADMQGFLHACASMVAPGGMMVIATLNRTAKAWALAIVGAEYVLGWLPKGTHQHSKFVRPLELRDALEGTGLRVRPPVGVSYNPLAGRWRLSGDTDVNYMVVCERETG